MRLAVGVDGHRRNARIGHLEIVELTQAEAHLVGGAYRGPVRRYYVAFRPLDSRLEGDVVTSHWTTVRPTDQVCFSLGELDDFKVADPRIPPVTVHTNSEAHRQLNRFFRSVEKQLQGSVFLSRFLSTRSPEEEVGADVANSLAFFTRVYGPPLFDRYYARSEEHTSELQ